MPGIDTMNDLAGLTGGRAFYADNGIDSLIEEAVEDSELIYTLGFYPSQESQDGDWHKLKVSVDRRGVSVRYRENYFASKTPADADLSSNLAATSSRHPGRRRNRAARRDHAGSGSAGRL